MTHHEYLKTTLTLKSKRAVVNLLTDKVRVAPRDRRDMIIAMIGIASAEVARLEDAIREADRDIMKGIKNEQI